MQENNNNLLCYSLFIFLYISIYTFFGMWLLFDGWINNFNSLTWLWSLPGETIKINQTINLAIYSILGSILGGSILSITSFHKYVAIEKNFDKDHIWGFIFTPILSILVGILSFVLIKSGLLILNGNMPIDSNSTNTINTSLGFIAIGSIAGYNWDVFVKKIQQLSKQTINTDEESNVR